MAEQLPGHEIWPSEEMTVPDPLVAAVSVSGPSFRVTAQKLPSIANHILQCVRGISTDMGFVSPGRATRPAWSA